MAGRKPIPTNLHILRGFPGKRPVNGNEPKFRAKIPPCPKHLGDESRKEWRRISRELDDAGLLTIVDRAALAGYCAAYGRWAEAEEKVREHGTIIKSKNGFPIMSPYLVIANKAWDQMFKALVEFGMSPSSRSRIHVSPKGSSDPQEDFLNG